LTSLPKYGDVGYTVHMQLGIVPPNLNFLQNFPARLMALNLMVRQTEGQQYSAVYPHMEDCITIGNIWQRI